MDLELMEIRFVHEDCVYSKNLNINTICASFDHSIDEDLLCSNISTILSNDCVQLKANDKITVEIPEWDMMYDVIVKRNFMNKTSKTATTSTTTTDLSGSKQSFGCSDKYIPETKIWTSRAINMLIENKNDLEHEFNSHKTNYKIWEKISKRLCENGVQVSGPNCSTKFKNLMSTFRDNIQRANKSGEGSINWEYFSLMKKYFGNKDSVAPKKNTLFETCLPNFKKKNCIEDDNSTLVTSHEVDSNITQTMPTKKRKQNFQDMLLEEIKKDRKSRDDFQKKLENFMDALIKIETAKLEKK